MSLWRITVKNSGCLNGIRLERGMSVQVVSTAHPLTSSGLGLVRDAFIRIYGIDLKAANALGGACLDVKKEGSRQRRSFHSAFFLSFSSNSSLYFS